MSAEPSQESSTFDSSNTLRFSIFVPVFFGVARTEPLPEGHAGPTEPDRLVAFNPLSQRMIIFQGGGGGGGGDGEGLGVDPLAAVMREVLALSEANGGRRGPPPASTASILAMKTVEAAEGDCPVCLERLQKERSLEVEKEEEGVAKERPLAVVVKEMPCGHKYHWDCIGKWLGMHGSCPVCRYRMPEEEEKGDGGKKAEEGGGEEGAERRGEVFVSIRLSSGEAQQPQQGSQEQDQQQQ